MMFPESKGSSLLIYTTRLIAGFSQIFMVIYFPVWVDLFGPAK